jgi:hypothetical protein
VYESPSDFIKHNWKGLIQVKKEYYWLLGGVVLGIIFAPQIHKLPLVNKLPTA